MIKLNAFYSGGCIVLVIVPCVACVKKCYLASFLENVVWDDGSSMTLAPVRIRRMRGVELHEICRCTLEFLRGGLSQVHARQSCYATREWIETENIKCPSRKFVLYGIDRGCPSKSYYLSSPPWPSASDGFLVFAIITLSLTNVTLGYTGVNWSGDKCFSWKLTLIPRDREQLFTTPGEVLSPYILASPAAY